MMRFSRRRAAAALAFAALAALAGRAAAVEVETARGPAEVAATPARVAVFDVAALDAMTAIGVSPAGVVSPHFVTYLDDAVAGAAPVGSLFEPDVEALYALQPDLIVVGGRSSGEYDALAEIAPTIDMTIWGEDFLDQVRARLRAYGAIFDRVAEAEAAEATLDAALADARAAAATAGTALIVLTNGPKISAYGPGSRFGWLHDATGLAPAAEGLDVSTHGQAVSFEFIAGADPDWLIVIDRASAIGQAGGSDTLDNELMAETRAMKAGHVVRLNAANVYVATGGVQSMTMTLQDLAAALRAGE